MAQADVVISWSFAGVPQSVRSLFKRPTKFVEIPTPPSRTYFAQVNSLGWAAPVRGILKKYAPGTEPLRIALLGFSESCSGVRSVLGSGDGNRIDSVIAIDGIHTPYVQSGSQKLVSPADMAPWFEFAKKAVLNDALLVDTYSSVKPPGYASTTETADWLWKTLNLDLNTQPISPALPPLSAPATTVKSNALPGVPSKIVEYPTIPWKLQRRASGLVLLGLSNNHSAGVADHQYQAKVMLPLALTAFLVERWNAIDPNDQKSSCYIAGSNPSGVAGPCASSQVLPHDYMMSTDSDFLVKASSPGNGPNPNPLPSGSSPSTPSDATAKKSNNAAIIVGGLVVAGAIAALA